MGHGIALSSILLYDPTSEHISRNSFVEFHLSFQQGSLYQMSRTPPYTFIVHYVTGLDLVRR